MSYKALLFCPDEESARLVTQVLSELEFTVELSFEPFVTVKKLSEEPFDALVVDCNDEQNASVLFKGARSSSLNHSSLCVAVAEGQAGVAKAFKIGANLVLTKPINIEQSKNTLRVAKGLLRKNTPPQRPATGASDHAESVNPAPANFSASAHLTEPSHAAPPPVVSSQTGLPARSANMPSSLFEAEQKKGPEPVPAIGVKHANPNAGFASSSSGAAAAPAMAREKADQVGTAATETRTAHEIKSAPPLATHDPIFADTSFHPQAEPNIPTILSHARRPAPSSGSGSKIFWIIACLLVVGVGGFFAWRKFQPMRYVHFGARQAESTASSSPAPIQGEPQDTKPSPDLTVAPDAQPSSPSTAPASGNVPTLSVSQGTSSAPEGFPTKERIDISIPAETPEPEPTVATKPLQVNRRAASTTAEEQPASAPAPPTLVLPSSSGSDSELAKIVDTNVVVPKPTPGTLRISQGITQGLLVKRVPPEYPMAALQMRREGVVELLASIGKNGAITKVRVLAGDAALAKSAVDAVRQWKYRPYLLNGEPVEIETQITINFKMPH
ncbi:MAG TPA: TonB family protein [Terriglobales bacterium]|nr:TonB family protein [Terriglobales bacterium]